MNRFLTGASVGIAVLVALLVSGFLWGTALTEQGVEQAIRRNFTAAGKLAQVQVAGEKMRRFEKEMFIYVALPEQRAGYAKEFDATYTRLLDLLDDVLAPSSAAFDDAERAEALRWKLAANFYASEFNNLVRRSGELSLASLSPEQRAALTVEFNNGIKAGKDRFRELLNGSEKMRQAKEARSQQIAGELQSIFTRLRLGTLIGGLLLVAVVLMTMRRQARVAVPLAAPRRSRPSA